MDKVKSINWNEASQFGLFERINREILHPLGLAMTRNVESGVSENLLIADDGFWEYLPDEESTIVADDIIKKALKLKLSKEDEEAVNA